ncbi:hypothetical protein M9458_021126, partial [Cirrhinus mrigala]
MLNDDAISLTSSDLAASALLGSGQDNIDGMRKNSYERMRPIEEMLASYLSMVLQAYQADLIKDLDKGQVLSPDKVAELRHTTDVALRATKQAATAIGRSIVVAERHLWVNLADIGKKEKGFFLNAPVSPFELFGTSIET